MKDVVIRTRHWLRGSEDGYLRSDSGQMCCLGFVCRAYEVKAKNLIGCSMPADLEDSDREKLPNWLLETAGAVLLAAEANDAVGLPLRSRQAKIRTIFRNHGLNPIFK